MKLRKAGLSMMLSPVAFYIIFAITHGLDKYGYWDLSTNLIAGLSYGVPCLLFTAAAWLWPLWGGVVAAGVFFAVITLNIIRIVTGIFFPLWVFSWTFLGLSYIFPLIGSILVLTSVRKDSS